MSEAEINEDMVRLIREITDGAGASGVPFLDDAVKTIVAERDEARSRADHLDALTDELGCKLAQQSIDLATAERERDAALRRAEEADVQVAALRGLHEQACKDREACIDCHAGPGTTEPACNACMTCQARRLDAAESTVAALREALRDLFALVEDGTLVRDISAVKVIRWALRWRTKANAESEPGIAVGDTLECAVDSADRMLDRPAPSSPHPGKGEGP